MGSSDPDPMRFSSMARPSPATHDAAEHRHAATGARTGIYASLRGDRHQGANEYQSPRHTDVHVLTVRLSAFRADRWHDGQAVRDPISSIGSSSITCAGIKSSRVIYGPWHSLQVFVPRSLEREIADQAELDRLDADRVERALIYDPVIHHLAESFVREVREGRAGSRLQLDALGTELCIHVLRNSTGRTGLPEIRSGGLADWQVRRAQDYIAAHFAEHVTLADLANEVQLTRFHFARAFKRSTGRAPHHYLLECRIERAKELLTTTEESIGTIAARVGYDDPTQLTRLFRSEIGLTPIAYRRSVRS